MRALNKDGMAMFKEWIISLNDDPSAEMLRYLLEDDLYSYGIPGSRVLEKRIFLTKYDLAETLFSVVSSLEGLRVNHDSWPGIWTALALFYFESVCRKNDAGWNPNSASYYVYGEHTGNKPKFYEHRIYGPITLYRTAPEHVRPFFDKTKASVMGQYEMSIGASNELAQNPSILEVLKKLYAKNESDTKRGYTSAKKMKGSSKKWDVPGGIRRIPKVCKQLRRTYDLPGVSSDNLLALLPEEFHDWLDA